MVGALNRLQNIYYSQNQFKNPVGSANSTNSTGEECQTCKNRKYKDGSNDPGVSFKTPTNVSPEKAAYAVRAHENEHVVREQAKAKKEGGEVISQSVTYQTSVCPECGRTFVSGGMTRTVTKTPIDNVFNSSDGVIKGQYLDLYA